MSPGAPPAPAPAPAPPPDRAPARGPNFVEDTLTDALASQLAHTTLAPPAPPAPASPRRPSRPRRRSSLSEFRFPVGVEQSGSGQSSAARGGAVGSPRPRQGQGQGQGMGGSESVSSGLAGGWTDERAAHPFAGSAQLLRRCVSDEDLGNGGEDDDAADDSGFDSDDEPFRMRPPSIASSTTSRRSSSQRFGVHLEDRSDRACAAFAKEVRIKGFYPVGDKAGGFVVFDIEVTSREGTAIHALKRYSAFVQLRNDLLRALPNLKGQLPRLPPKSSLSKYRPSFLERRRQQLGFWLTSVLLHPEAGASTIMRAWVLEQ